MLYSFVVMLDAETDFPFHGVTFYNNISDIPFDASIILLKFKQQFIRSSFNKFRLQIDNSFKSSLCRNLKKLLLFCIYQIPCTLICFQT